MSADSEYLEYFNTTDPAKVTEAVEGSVPVEPTPVQEETDAVYTAAQELIDDPEAALDEALASQEEPEEEPSAPVAPVAPVAVFRDALLMNTLITLVEGLQVRVTLLEQRIDEHNVRSGHKI